MARVIVVQEPLRRDSVRGVIPRIDYNTLTPYGRMEFLFSWGALQDDDALENTADLVWQLRAKLHDFADEDYIVPLGNPALCAMAVAVAADCNDGRVRILDWIRNDGKYRTVSVDLDCQPVR